MNTRKAMSEAIAVLDAPGSQGVGRTMYLKTRWTKVEEPSRSGRLLSRAGGQDTCKRVYRGARGGGGVRTRARARVKPPGWCLCAASVRRVRVVLCEFTNTHTQTHTNRPAAENALELTIDLRGGGVAVEEWMRGGGYGGKGDTTGSDRGGESARCRGCQGDAPRGPGARWRRRGGRLLAVRRRPKPAKTRRAAAQSEAGRGAGEWVGFKVQGVG